MTGFCKCQCTEIGLYCILLTPWFYVKSMIKLCNSCNKYQNYARLLEIVKKLCRSKLPLRSPLPAGHLPLRSIVCDTLAFLLFILLLHNGLFPTWPPLRSTVLYTQMTSNGQCNVNRWPIKSSERKAVATVIVLIAFSSYVLRIYL